MNTKLGLFNLGQSRFRSLQAINQDIDDEIRFHLESRVAELVQQGMERDEAIVESNRAFGSTAEVRRQCQRINYGDRILWNRIAIGSLIASAGLIIWLAFALHDAKHRNQLLASRLQGDSDLILLSDVHGRVCDHEGNPLATADVLVAVKHWPPGGFRQQTYTTTTDNSGNYNVKTVVPIDLRHEVQVAIVHEGYSFQSQYVTRNEPDGTLIDSIDFRLEPAHPLRAIVRDTKGNPIPGATVFPHQRFSGSGDATVYYDSSPPIQRNADTDGIVSIGHFSVGDRAILAMRAPGGEWQNRDVEIEESTSIINLVINDPQDFNRSRK